VPPYFLAEGNPAEVHGLNSVGLRRRNFSADTIAELKNAYKLIYRSGNNVRQAIGALKAEIGSDAGRHLLAFLEAPSERGILK